MTRASNDSGTRLTLMDSPSGVLSMIMSKVNVKTNLKPKIWLVCSFKSAVDSSATILVLWESMVTNQLFTLGDFGCGEDPMKTRKK